MGLRKHLIMLSIALLLAGLFSAIGRQLTPGGTDAFNLGVDFQGGTVITAKFNGKPSEDELRAACRGFTRHRAQRRKIHGEVVARIGLQAGDADVHAI